MDRVAKELKGHYKALSQSKYSTVSVMYYPRLKCSSSESGPKFLAAKLIRLRPAHHASILLEFQLHVLKLFLHREASNVLLNSTQTLTNARSCYEIFRARRLFSFPLAEELPKISKLRKGDFVSCPTTLTPAIRFDTAKI